MTVISARRVRLRRGTVRHCDHCQQRIIGSAIRMYGMAHTGDQPYAVYLHPHCVHPAAAKAEPKIAAALRIDESTGGAA